jgi:hypothetical protein
VACDFSQQQYEATAHQPRFDATVCVISVGAVMICRFAQPVSLQLLGCGGFVPFGQSGGGEGAIICCYCSVDELMSVLHIRVLRIRRQLSAECDVPVRECCCGDNIIYLYEPACEQCVYVQVPGMSSTMSLSVILCVQPSSYVRREFLWYENITRLMRSAREHRDD